MELPRLVKCPEGCCLVFPPGFFASSNGGEKKKVLLLGVVLWNQYVVLIVFLRFFGCVGFVSYGA